MASQTGICHFQRLWTGMFDHHQAEINVMQFRGHPLPVHQFLTVLWDFNPVPYYQPSSPTQAISSPGRRSIYNIKFTFKQVTKRTSDNLLPHCFFLAFTFSSLRHLCFILSKHNLDACNVTVITIINGIGEQSSNTGRCYLYFSSR